MTRQPYPFYAVAKGHSVGVFTSWENPGGAEEATRGFSGSSHKGFRTEEAACAWLKEKRGGEVQWVMRPVLLKRPDERVCASTTSTESGTSGQRVLTLRRNSMDRRVHLPCWKAVTGIMLGLVAITVTFTLAWLCMEEDM